MLEPNKGNSYEISPVLAPDLICVYIDTYFKFYFPNFDDFYLIAVLMFNLDFIIYCKALSVFGTLC